jgi:DNA-binding transcriptional ArsR family regulator
MTSGKADLLLHPIRLRVVLASSGTEVTAADLAARLTDVPQATLYRQIAILVDAGILEVVAERRVRGAVERTLRLVADEATLGPEDAARLTPEQHQRGFVTFVGALIEAFGRYLDTPGADVAHDPVGYRQASLWLTDQEAHRLVGDLRVALDPYLSLEPAEGRRRVRLSTVLIPEATPMRTESRS